MEFFLKPYYDPDLKIPRPWVTYLNLDTMSGFHHESNTVHTYEFRFINTDPYNFMLVGGYSVHWKNVSPE